MNGIIQYVTFFVLALMLSRSILTVGLGTPALWLRISQKYFTCHRAGPHVGSQMHTCELSLLEQLADSRAAPDRG